jgi:hypothetical protein
LFHYLGEPLWWHPYSDLRAVYGDQKPHTPPFSRLPRQDNFSHRNDAIPRTLAHLLGFASPLFTELPRAKVFSETEARLRP